MWQPLRLAVRTVLLVNAFGLGEEAGDVLHALLVYADALGAAEEICSCICCVVSRRSRSCTPSCNLSLKVLARV